GGPFPIRLTAEGGSGDPRVRGPTGMLPDCHSAREALPDDVLLYDLSIGLKVEAGAGQPHLDLAGMADPTELLVAVEVGVHLRPEEAEDYVDQLFLIGKGDVDARAERQSPQDNLIV